MISKSVSHWSERGGIKPYTPHPTPHTLHPTPYTPPTDFFSKP
ncbi:hypothetical protein BFG60_0018 [Microcystis aeruginosa NIES-98]|nr:hypothetical protein BFG60_0018 [Microcystis aeruginosa NIES-98]